MTMMQQAVGAIIGVLALSALAASPAGAQIAKGPLDPNEAAESELAQLPNMTPAIARSMVENRPFKTIIELNKFLPHQKLVAPHAKHFSGQTLSNINHTTA